MTTAEESVPDYFSLRRVFARAFAMAARQPAAFLLLPILFTLPMLAMEAARPFLEAGLMESADFAVSAFCMSLVHAAITHLSLSDRPRDGSSIRLAISATLRAVAPLFGITLLYTAGVMVGLVLLIVPGVMLMMAWCVAVPAYVVERTAVTGALARSAELTHGYRWDAFILTLVCGVVVAAIGMALQRLASVSEAPWASVASTFATGVVAAVVFGTGITSLYWETRMARNGIPPQDLEVFD